MKIRPTIEEARIKRAMKQAERRAKVATRNAAHTAHRDSLHTIASHLRAMGADNKTATAIAATLRKKTSPGVRGFALKDGVRRTCTRYTRAQVLAALTVYKPRKRALIDARTNMLALAA